MVQVEFPDAATHCKDHGFVPSHAGESLDGLWLPFAGLVRWLDVNQTAELCHFRGFQEPLLHMPQPGIEEMPVLFLLHTT